MSPTHSPLFKFHSYSTALDRLYILLGAIGSIGNGVSLPLFTLFFGDVINSIGLNIGNADAIRSTVNENIVKIVYVGIAAFAASFMQVFFWTITGVRQVNKLRSSYLQCILNQEIAFYDTEGNGSGPLLQGLNEDSKTVQLSISDKTGMTIFNLSMAVSGIGIAFSRGWDMTLVLLALTPLLGFFGYAISTLMQTNTLKMNKAYADANAIAQQAFGNVRTVYAMNAEKRTAQQYDDSLEEPMRVGIRQGMLSGLTVGATNCVAFCAYALAMWYGGTRVADGAYTGGDVLNVLFSALIGGFALGQAAPNLQYFQQGKAAGARMFHVMERTPKIDMNAPGTQLDSIEGRVSLKNVTFAYPTQPNVIVFNNFNLEIPAGLTVALVGESGSGKSTVVSLIQRFYDPLSGAIFLDGHDIRTLQLRWLRSQIGLVSQEPMLFATTIFDNIQYGRPGASEEDVYAAAKAANAHDFIVNLPRGYRTQVGEKGTQMSGGQKQRIAIARAMVRAPTILLLDEASSALDAKSEHIVQNALEKLMKGRTTVIVAHRLSTVRDADSIAVVKSGVIQEKGTYDELIARNGLFSTLVHMQNMCASERGAAYTINKDISDEDDVLTKSVSESPSPREFADVALRSPIVRAMAPTVAAGQSVSNWRRFASLRRRRITSTAAPPRQQEGQNVDKNLQGTDSVPYRRLLVLNKPELPMGLLGILASAAMGLMMPFFAIAFSNLVSDFYSATPSTVESSARKWSLIFVAIGFGGLVAAVIQSHAFSFMGQKLAQRVRSLLIRSVLRQEVGWFDKEENSSGALTGRLASDALDIRGVLGDTAGLITQNLATFIASYIIAFTASWKMTLVVSGAIPVIVIATGIQVNLIIRFSQQEGASYANANQIASEAVGAVRTVTAFSMQDQVTRLYDHQLVGPTKESRWTAVVSGLGFGVSQLTIFGVFALCFWYAGVLISDCPVSLTETIGCFNDVLKSFFAIFLAAVACGQALLYFPAVGRGKSAVNRVFAILDRQSLIDSAAPDGDKLPQVRGEIEFRNVTFAYPQRPSINVLTAFNLSISAGSTVALVGESGQGKSSIVSLIERFYDPLEGNILLDGHDIRQLNLEWLRRQIGLVNQEPVLFSLPAVENIRYGCPEASLEDVIAAARAAGANAFLEALPNGYNTKLGDGGVQLSGGQKQRVAIARALVKKCKVLLLDESTSALDAESEAAIQKALDEMLSGTTKVIVAHRLSTVRNADTIAVIHGGVIVEQGSHEQLMSARGGAYARLVQFQLHGSKEN